MCIFVQDPLQEQIAEDGTIAGHRDPHDVVELAGLRAAQGTLAARRGQTKVFLAILDPFAVAVMVPGEDAVVTAIQ